MPWRIDTQIAGAIDETETWRKREVSGVLIATHSITYQSGYTVVSTRPKIELLNPKCIDVYDFNNIEDGNGKILKECWEWPQELSDGDLHLLETLYRKQPMSLYSQGWELVVRRRIFFGPLILTKLKWQGLWRILKTILATIWLTSLNGMLILFCCRNSTLRRNLPHGYVRSLASVQIASWVRGTASVIAMVNRTLLFWSGQAVNGWQS